MRIKNRAPLQPYRKRGRKFKYNKAIRDLEFPNRLLNNIPEYPNHIWASNFIHIAFRGEWLYLAVYYNPPVKILHSNHGSEYASHDYSNICLNLGIKQSMSQPGCLWENGYQESFYFQFKIDLGDPGRFNSLRELVYNIHRTIYRYNYIRIHTKLKYRLFYTFLENAKNQRDNNNIG